MQQLLSCEEQTDAVAPLQTVTVRMDCFCIGETARKAAESAAKAATGMGRLELFDAHRKLPWAEKPNWEDFTAAWQAAYQATEQAHPLYAKPDPDCWGCEGLGWFETHKPVRSPKIEEEQR